MSQRIELQPRGESPRHVEEPDISELVIDDGAPVDNIYSEKQQRLLTEALYASWQGPPSSGAPRPFVAMSDVGVFMSPDEPPLVPDAMVSVDVAVTPEIMANPRGRTYLVWKFGKVPDIVVEVVSNDEGHELGSRYEGYEHMRVSYYVVWDPFHQIADEELQAFELRGGSYHPIDDLRFEALGLALAVWEGEYEGVQGRWLRWHRLDGTVINTGKELATEAEERAGAAEERAGAAEKRAEQLLAVLRSHGIDPDA